MPNCVSSTKIVGLPILDHFPTMNNANVQRLIKRAAYR